MDEDARVEEIADLRNSVELVRSVSDKHLDLLRPSARNYSIFRGQAIDVAGNEKGKYALIRDPEDFQTGIYDKPLPYYGCGIGWLSNHYLKDPREGTGLGASAIAALVCSVALLIIGAILLLKSRSF